MAEETTLSVNGLELNYVRSKEGPSLCYARVSAVCFFLLMLVASAVLFAYQVSDNRVFSELARYSRIKSAITRWKPLVRAKARVAAELGRRRAASSPGLFEFRCVDFGTYFLPVRLSRDSFLPQAIRRGDGDGWMVRKAAKSDPAALQFCQHVISRFEGNVVTCGSEMFKELGYSGYFERGHWCQQFLELVQ
ncbi:IMV membrane protein [Eastern grey kangaroopox virus]|uniref:IMV membrane protein n=1 Tax=Eastern grey kangaroopox virus TaxID=2042482 RepID=A0A2C9DT48_9POXV|nr:IMV membrane protein [Eastern grey kangaroopox virus]ATI21181.1 IMV membrane protein [Eastern grey kangaroopox virus]AXK50178.1 IMV membrane protein [Eastern grey kangaroopox virus]